MGHVPRRPVGKTRPAALEGKFENYKQVQYLDYKPETMLA